MDKYQWTATGMRPDDSIGGPMHYYRGSDADCRIEELKTAMRMAIESINDGAVSEAWLLLDHALSDKGGSDGA